MTCCSLYFAIVFWSGVLIVEDEILEPVDGLDVEVVGRLVEHDDVGLAEQRLREQHLDLQPRVSICLLYTSRCV